MPLSPRRIMTNMKLMSAFEVLQPSRKIHLDEIPQFYEEFRVSFARMGFICSLRAGPTTRRQCFDSATAILSRFIE